MLTQERTPIENGGFGRGVLNLCEKRLIEIRQIQENLFSVKIRINGIYAKFERHITQSLRDDIISTLQTFGFKGEKLMEVGKAIYKFIKHLTKKKKNLYSIKHA